ncbi:MAG: hypothetical protein GY811_28900 [Myxococcales bacterium]|nr:hypothetical protein [Myxococcales bacterium]
MAPEHVLEFAHLLGMETDVESSGRLHRRAPYNTTLVEIINERGEGNSIHSQTEWEVIGNDAVDVNYPTYGSISIPAQALVHNTWDAADPGKEDWVQYRDERVEGGWQAPPNAADPFASQISSRDYEGLEILNSLP